MGWDAAARSEHADERAVLAAFRSQLSEEAIEAQEAERRAVSYDRTSSIAEPAIGHACTFFV